MLDHYNIIKLLNSDCVIKWTTWRWFRFMSNGKCRLKHALG